MFEPANGFDPFGMPFGRRAGVPVARTNPQEEAPSFGDAVRILLTSKVLNGLVKFVLLELKGLGHSVALHTGNSEAEVEKAARTFKPECVLSVATDEAAPPATVTSHRCLCLTYGPDNGTRASSLGGAILNGELHWRVCVSEQDQCSAVRRLWSSRQFAVREASKSSVYRDELTRAAAFAAIDAIQMLTSQSAPLGGSERWEPSLPANSQLIERPDEKLTIDWHRDSTRTILRKIWAADGSPGVPDEILGVPVHLFGAHQETRIKGPPGDLLAQRSGAICRGAIDGAVWISHLRSREAEIGKSFKLPATHVLGDLAAKVPELNLATEGNTDLLTFRDIWYTEHNAVGYINFRLYNGAMGVRHCQRLEQAVRYARRRPTKAIVLLGGRDFWSNGIDLNQIEAADDPAEEAWRNINAMNDFVLSLLMATDQVTIAALYGNAAGGGAMMALACDRILARSGVVLYPHHRSMGGFRGSEYWTYTLPKRVGPEVARKLTEQCLPITAESAQSIGLVDQVLLHDELDGSGFEAFQSEIRGIVEDLASGPTFDAVLRNKQARWQADDWVKPLELYRVAELAEVSRNLWGSVSRYDRVRSDYVRKRSCSDATVCLSAAEAVCANPYCDRAQARMSERLSLTGS